MKVRVESRHVARSGKQAGQLVKCFATGVCRNGGMHITEKDFHAARELHQQQTGEKVNLTQMTLPAVMAFVNSTDEEKEAAREAVEKKREEAKQKREAKAQAKREQDADIARAVRALPEVLAQAEAEKMAKDPKVLAGNTITMINSLWRPALESEDPADLTYAEQAKLTQLSRNLGLSTEEKRGFYTIATIAARHRRLRKTELDSRGLGNDGFNSWMKMSNLMKTAAMVQNQPSSKIYQKLFREELAETVVMGTALADKYKKKAEQQVMEDRKIALGKKILNLFWRTD